ncbi:MAG: hypothetical protein HY721_26630 [Planctomycetes bacterium]|nr:hypothetical protein [Planctomycetota bacterium]
MRPTAVAGFLALVPSVLAGTTVVENLVSCPFCGQELVASQAASTTVFRRGERDLSDDSWSLFTSIWGLPLLPLHLAEQRRAQALAGGEGTGPGRPGEPPVPPR